MGFNGCCSSFDCLSVNCLIINVYFCDIKILIKDICGNWQLIFNETKD